MTRLTRLTRLSRSGRLAAGLCVLLAGGGLAACGGSGSSTQSITVYSGQHEQTTEELVTAFEKATNIKVDVRYNDEDTFAQQILQEGSHPTADVFYTENTPALQEIQDKGLLAPLDKSTLSQTASRYDSAQGDWVGVSARVSVMIYDPKLINASQLPTNVLQLADPKYKGKLAFAPGETDFQPIVTSVVRAYGAARAKTWLEGIKSNASGHLYEDNETIADDVNRGVAAFGLINQYYWYRMGAELGGTSHLHSELAYFAPGDPGYVLDVSGAGVLAHSSNEAGAQKFVAFLVSTAGQKIIANSLSFEYPLDHGVTTTAHETPLKDLHPNSITVADLGNGSTAIDLLQKAGLL